MAEKRSRHRYGVKKITSLSPCANDIVLYQNGATRGHMSPIANFRHYVHKPAIVKLLLLIYGLNSGLLFYTVDHAHHAQPTN